MNNHHELAEVLGKHEDCAFSASGVLVCTCGVSMQPQEVMDDMANLASHQADVLLAAGYRKPRTIATREEMDALQVGSVILVRGVALSKESDDEPAGLHWVPAGTPMGFTSGELALPATVLHEPEPRP